MIGLLLLAAALPSAHAGSTHSSAQSSGMNDESVTVPIVHRNDMETLTLLNPPTSGEKPITRKLELSVSSWAPSSFQSPSNITATNFQSSVVPGLSLTYLATLKNYRWADIDWKAGVGYVGMSRESTLPIGSLTENQSLYLFSGNIGADLKPAKLRMKEFSPYVGASLMPTFAVTNQAVQNEGASTFGVPYQFAIGTTIGSRWTGYQSLKNMELNVAVVKTLSGIGESSLSGTGLVAGVRFMNF